MNLIVVGRRLTDPIRASTFPFISFFHHPLDCRVREFAFRINQNLEINSVITHYFLGKYLLALETRCRFMGSLFKFSPFFGIIYEVGWILGR